MADGSFGKADKQRILRAADHWTAPGEIGALMRREGLYSSSPSTWRRQRKAAELAALVPQRRPKLAADCGEALQIARLTRDNDCLRIGPASVARECSEWRSHISWPFAPVRECVTGARYSA